MTHNRDGTDFGFPLIRGKTRDDPEGKLPMRRKVKYMFIFNYLTDTIRSEWETNG